MMPHRGPATLAVMDLELLQEVLSARGEPRFRARQVWAWAARGARSYAEMTDLPAALRDALSERVPLSSLTVEREALAADGTEKTLFHTADGRPLEAVLMRYRDGRRSVCLSSQSGCPLTCTFCATGSMKFGRNLTVSEILDQALHFRGKEAEMARPEIRSRPREGDGAVPAPISNAVFMGMGEPLLNLDAVLAACERLPDIGIHPSSTTISTVGWIPGIDRLTEHDGPTVRLALSLHAPDDALRSELMPVNERYPLADVLDACRRWHERRRRKVFVEYLMLAGVNDRYEQAVALARLLTSHSRGERPAASREERRPIAPREERSPIADRASTAPIVSRASTAPILPFKVNLIPYNPTGSRFEGSSRDAIEAFRAALAERGVPATVRLTRGRDIDAACGQLAARG